ncbi:heavy metal translocating P-type ATPase [Christiangramia portivictoriae]|uniref:heavy metal translocating P-type ATPase n=1 Tax=Christiangramia portivictoriae TaxID=326069 RepID=UPI0003F68819|nr:heavy metal translocating P-type ATPase [Christiangramia portivictoriae]
MSGHNHGACDSHTDGVFGKRTELIFSVLSGVFLLIGFLLQQFSELKFLFVLIPFLLSYFLGGYYTAKEAIHEISKARFEIDFLMLVAAIGAAFLDKWAEGGLLLFLFSLGHALEHLAMDKAQKSIEALTNLAPKQALKKIDGQFQEVDLNDLEVGDILRVRPNSTVPADSILIHGRTTINQASITGESIPVDKLAIEGQDIDIYAIDSIPDKYRAFAGTINGDATIELKVIRKAEDSTLSRLIEMVQQAQDKKSPTQLLTDKFEKFYVPAVLILILILNFAFIVLDEPWSASFYRSMAALVAASPCALAISTPSAVLSGIARAARGGVLFKGGKPLEDLGTLTTLAFDKTGTLTEGNPKLTDVVLLNNTSEEQLLSEVVALESSSNHPLAKAIVRDGEMKLPQNYELPQLSTSEAIQGKGITGDINGKSISIGNLELFQDGESPDNEIAHQISRLEQAGKTTMLVKSGTQFVGILGLMDVPRKSAKPTLMRLKQLGIKEMLMLTGDNQFVADAVANDIGITEAYGSLLPEEKVSKIREFSSVNKKVAMIGDGVNDAPAMANSTVGIAMGAAGSDVALETADIALMADKLEVLPFAIGLSRKAHTIVKQNLWISLGVVALLLPATIFGWANIGIAVVFHEGSTLVVVLNALRLLAYKSP